VGPSDGLTRFCCMHSFAEKQSIVVLQLDGGAGAESAPVGRQDKAQRVGVSQECRWANRALGRGGIVAMRIHKPFRV
jgi:hypothetical protein